METAKIVEKVSAIVILAGKTVRDRFGGSFSTSFKSSPADLVTEVDRNSQSIILKGLSREFTGHRLVAEEDFSEDELRLDDRPVWFIDPLDGTTNFVFGIPFCAVTVCLAVEGRPLLGVTYDPFREELFTACRGEGAFLNHRRVQADRRRRDLGESLLVTGFPSSERFKGEMLGADYAAIFSAAGDVRALGSAALELAYVACGRLTGFWEVGLRPWDVAAGMIMVEEAGGTVSDLLGNKLDLANHISIAASNGLIHDQLIEKLGYLSKSRYENK